MFEESKNEEVENEEIAEEHVTEDAVSETEEPEIIIGVVTNCNKLNIREKPVKADNIICELNKGTELMIDLDNSTDEWYRVYLESGITGFCMKEYVEVA